MRERTLLYACPHCGWSLSFEREEQLLLLTGGRVMADCSMCERTVICELRDLPPAEIVRRIMAEW